MTTTIIHLPAARAIEDLTKSMVKWRAQGMDKRFPEEYARHMFTILWLKLGGPYTPRVFGREEILASLALPVRPDIEDCHPAHQMVIHVGRGVTAVVQMGHTTRSKPKRKQLLKAA